MPDIVTISEVFVDFNVLACFGDFSLCCPLEPVEKGRFRSSMSARIPGLQSNRTSGEVVKVLPLRPFRAVFSLPRRYLLCFNV